jgi:acyl-CoA synthetase (AMP-forming)/AMP-acid ligase II
VIGSEPSGRFEAAQLIEALSRHRVTLLSVVPTMLRRMLDSEQPRWVTDRALRAVLLGGAPSTESLRRESAERGIPVLATYGCTEACSQISTQNLAQSGLPGSGAPLPGVRLRIEDGEIQVQAATLMDGYLEADEPFTEDGWFRTADSGRFLSDGQLHVQGRLDDLIISGGENVAPQEVEVFLETIPGVVAACVFPLPSEEWGQELVAALVVDEAFTRPAFFEQVRLGLAPHRRPKRICTVDALPLNRSGKLDRREVATRHGASVV